LRKTSPVRGELALRSAPVTGDHLGHREAVLRVLNARLEKFSKRPSAKALPQLFPAIDTARNRPAQRAEFRNLLQAALREQLAAGTVGRSAIGVQAMEFLRLAVPDDDEEVAADPARHRLHEADGSVGSDGGVHRVAALLEDVDADLRDQRMAGRHHAMRGDDHGAAGTVRLRYGPLSRYCFRHEHQTAKDYGCENAMHTMHDEAPAKNPCRSYSELGMIATGL
jgi:hypothetical protein